MWPWPRLLEGTMSSQGYHLVYSTWDKVWQLSLQPFRRYDCGRQNWKCVMWPRPRPRYGWFVIWNLGLDIVYICAKFDNSSFSRSRDMVGAHQNLNGSHDLRHFRDALSDMGWHLLRSTHTPSLKSLWPPATKIWKALKMWKMGWFGVVGVTQGHWK